MKRKSMSRRVIRVSLTPLIDIIFILLIFFMLSTQFVQWRRLSLTVAATTATTTAVDPPHRLTVDAEGQLTLDGAPFDLTGLIARLRETPTHAVVVEPEATAATQQIVRVLDALQGAGMTQVGLRTDLHSEETP